MEKTLGPKPTNPACDRASLVKTNIDGETGVLHELELPREDGTDNPGHGGQCGLVETSIQVTLLKSVYVPD